MSRFDSAALTVQLVARSIRPQRIYVKTQTLSRRASSARCDLTNQNSSQRASSSQGASCSGRQWLSSPALHQQTAQQPLECKAKLQESDLQLPKTDGSGNDGPGNLGGNGGSGGGGGDEGAGGDGDDEDERLLNTAEVCVQRCAVPQGLAGKYLLPDCDVNQLVA